MCVTGPVPPTQPISGTSPGANMLSAVSSYSTGYASEIARKSSKLCVMQKHTLDFSPATRHKKVSVH